MSLEIAPVSFVSALCFCWLAEHHQVKDETTAVHGKANALENAVAVDNVQHVCSIDLGPSGGRARHRIRCI